MEERDRGEAKNLMRSKTRLQRRKKRSLPAGSFKSNQALTKDCEKRKKSNENLRGRVYKYERFKCRSLGGVRSTKDEGTEEQEGILLKMLQ